MKRRCFPALFLGVLACAVPPASGSNVILYPGQSYRSGDDNVVCTERRQAEPVVLSDCQIWDDFNKKCLFEQTRYLFNGLECLEECQHWDSFNERCDYAVSCSFQASSGQFVQTVCDDFDAFNHKCRRQKERLLGERTRKKTERP